jgi:hypothetical protein
MAAVDLTAQHDRDVPKGIWSWAMYDRANSAFTTLVVAFIDATSFSKAMAPCLIAFCEPCERRARSSGLWSPPRPEGVGGRVSEALGEGGACRLTCLKPIDLAEAGPAESV